MRRWSKANPREAAAAQAPPPLPERGRVTALAATRRQGRVVVLVDGAPALELDREVALVLGLAPGREVDRSLLAAARDRDGERQARECAVRLLAARPRTAAEVERKLVEKGYAEAAIAGAMGYLQAQGWLDDREFARQYIRSRLAGRGARGEVRLAQELRRRGVDQETVQAALADVCGAEDPLNWALELARARLERLRGQDQAAARRRLGAFLVRRGFDSETVSRALRALRADLADPDA